MKTLKTTCFFALLILIISLQPGIADAQTQSINSEHHFLLQNDGLALAATILKPDSSSANGTGIVMLPGSGPAVRGMLKPAAGQLLQDGITVLIFDKRGSGESQGDWTKSSLDELAGDATAALTQLRNQAGINYAGFWAHSQGNWVATRAAELGAKPDFIIAASGGGASPRQVERFSYSAKVSSADTDQQALAMALVDNYFEYLAGNLSREELDRQIEAVKSTDWYPRLGIDRVLVSPTYRPKWQWVADYDPAKPINNMDFPVLVLLGGADHFIPLELTITKWDRQLAGGNPASRIVTFPGRGHHLSLTGTGHGHGISTDSIIWKTTSDWLKQALPIN